MGLAATLLLAACSGSSSDDSTATNQVPADTETVADSEQQMPPPTSVEAPDVTGATDAGIATIDDDSSAALPTIEPDEPATDPETGPEPAEWQSVFADATASGPPPVVDCPADSAPTSGEISPTPEFLELTIGGPRGVVAAFDSNSHSLFVVRISTFDRIDDVLVNEVVAGRLDVCSGNWSRVNADFGTSDHDGTAAWPTALVYDADSDALVAFTDNGVRVYDNSSDVWRLLPDVPMRGVPPWVARYHPGSGTIIAATHIVGVYDVDRNEWQPIPEAIYVGFYVEFADAEGRGEFLGIDGDGRLVFVAGSGDSHVTLLVDPATGQATQIETPGRPPVQQWNITGPWEASGQAGGTIYVSDRAEGTICGFDASTLAWDACIDHQLGDGDGYLSVGDHAIVGDPIHDRLIIVPPSGPILTEPLP